MKRLVIISDTPFYAHGNDILVFEPTLREIEEVSSLFTAIKWVSYLRSGTIGKNTRQPTVPITLVPIRDRRGGTSFSKKFGVLMSIPSQVLIFLREIKHADVVHTRAPSVPALIVILYSFFDNRRIYWHKYAGNWSETNSPVAFRLQKWLMTKLNKPNVRITINGDWPGLHKGFVSMENPCLNEEYLRQLKHRKFNREFTGKLKVCFVGSLDPFKGAVRLLHALLSSDVAPSLNGVWIVGDGQEKEQLKQLASQSPVPVHLCGYLSRQEIFDTIYSHCHIIVLPSETEGFPKVIAEAASHGCIPVVTAVSALDQYIKNGVNGFLLQTPTIESIRQSFVNDIIPNNKLHLVSEQAAALAHLFTYERFRDRIQQEVLTAKGS